MKSYETNWIKNKHLFVFEVWPTPIRTRSEASEKSSTLWPDVSFNKQGNLMMCAMLSNSIAKVISIWWSELKNCSEGKHICVFIFIRRSINKSFNLLFERLDQTLGKPGSHLSIGMKCIPIGTRLYRMEQQINIIDKKVDNILKILNHFIEKGKPSIIQRTHSVEETVWQKQL